MKTFDMTGWEPFLFGTLVGVICTVMVMVHHPSPTSEASPSANVPSLTHDTATEPTIKDSVTAALDRIAAIEREVSELRETVRVTVVNYTVTAPVAENERGKR